MIARTFCTLFLGWEKSVESLSRMQAEKEWLTNWKDASYFSMEIHLPWNGSTINSYKFLFLFFLSNQVIQVWNGFRFEKSEVSLFLPFQASNGFCFVFCILYSGFSIHVHNSELPFLIISTIASWSWLAFNWMFYFNVPKIFLF